MNFLSDGKESVKQQEEPGGGAHSSVFTVSEFRVAVSHVTRRQHDQD